MAELEQTKPLLSTLLECLIFGLFYFYTTLFTTMFNSLQAVLDPIFSKQQIGTFLLILFLSAALTTIPGGIILDKINLKRLLLVVMASYVCSVAVFLFSPGIKTSKILFFSLGVFGAFSFNSAIRYAELRVPRKRLSLVTGLFLVIGNLACILAQTPVVILSNAVGLKGIFLIITVLGISILLLIKVYVTPAKSPLNYKTLLFKTFLLNCRKQLKAVISKTKNWGCIIYIAFANLPASVLGGAWNNMYLVNTHNLTFFKASVVTAMIYIGLIIGSPSTGWVCDKFTIHKPLLLVGNIGLLTTMLAIIYASSSISSLMVLYLFLGIFCGTQPAAYSLLRKTNCGLSGITLGFVAAFSAASTGIFIYLFSYLANMNIDGGADYHTPILILPLSFILTLIFTIFLKE